MKTLDVDIDARITVRFDHVLDSVILTSSRQMLASMLSRYLIEDIKANVLDENQDNEIAYVATAKRFVAELESDINCYLVTLTRLNEMSKELAFTLFEISRVD